MKKILAMTAMFGALTAGSAFALPINDRPGDVVPGTPSDSSELTLQQILDTYVTPPSSLPDYNAITSQSRQALWSSTDGGSKSFLVSLFTGHPDGIFGIYSNTGNTYNLIDRDSTSATGKSFTVSNTGDLLDGDLNTLFNNFGKTFGFFWKDTNHNDDPAYIAYTEDTMNANDAVRALTYQLAGGTLVSSLLPSGARNIDEMTGGNDWLMAFEDHPNGDFDYNDTVFMVKDISPVPEPGTMLLLGAGFLGLAIYGKRRKNA